MHFLLVIMFTECGFIWWQMVLPIAVQDVKREVQILEALTGHENVVQFHNAFENDSYVYIVME